MMGRVTGGDWPAQREANSASAAPCGGATADRAGSTDDCPWHGAVRPCEVLLVTIY
jgi:hypothetical protein